MSETYELKTIGHVRSDFPEKFGIPRRAGIVDALEAAIIFEPEYQREEALRGLDGFSHIWVIRPCATAGRRGCGRRVSAATRAWAYLRRAHPSVRTRWGFPACGCWVSDTVQTAARIFASRGQT